MKTKKSPGRGLIGRRVRVGNHRRTIELVGDHGSVKLDRPIIVCDAPMSWWNIEDLKFVRGNYEEKPK